MPPQSPTEDPLDRKYSGHERYNYGINVSTDIHSKSRRITARLKQEGTRGSLKQHRLYLRGTPGCRQAEKALQDRWRRAERRSSLRGAGEASVALRGGERWGRRLAWPASPALLPPASGTRRSRRPQPRPDRRSGQRRGTPSRGGERHHRKSVLVPGLRC